MTIADDLLSPRYGPMTLPRELPGRYGRVIQDLERMLVATLKIGAHRAKDIADLIELVRRAAVSIVPGGRGSCRTKAKLGRSLSLPLKSQAGSFQPAARLKANGSKLEEIAQYLSQKHPSYAEEFAELRRQAKEETSF